jgi:hypothetical protein
MEGMKNRHVEISWQESGDNLALVTFRYYLMPKIGMESGLFDADEIKMMLETRGHQVDAVRIEA